MNCELRLVPVLMDSRTEDYPSVPRVYVTLLCITFYISMTNP